MSQNLANSSNWALVTKSSKKNSDYNIEGSSKHKRRQGGVKLKKMYSNWIAIAGKWVKYVPKINFNPPSQNDNILTVSKDRMFICLKKGRNYFESP